jgi:fructose-1,6-bisphosphatase/sedoheptulose 1,7-bisphosphatase-like protein
VVEKALNSAQNSTQTDSTHNISSQQNQKSSQEITNNTNVISLDNEMKDENVFENQITITPQDLMNAVREMNLHNILNMYTFIEPRENDGKVNPCFLLHNTTDSSPSLTQQNSSCPPLSNTNSNSNSNSN